MPQWLQRPHRNQGWDRMLNDISRYGHRVKSARFGFSARAVRSRENQIDTEIRLSSPHQTSSGVFLKRKEVELLPQHPVVSPLCLHHPPLVLLQEYHNRTTVAKAKKKH